MENNDFFTQEEHKQLILLYKRLLRLSKDTLQKDDCHKLKTHLVKAMAEGTIPRNVFQMNPIIKDMQTAVIVAEEIGMHYQGYADGCHRGRRNRYAPRLDSGNHAP